MWSFGYLVAISRNLYFEKVFNYIIFQIVFLKYTFFGRSQLEKNIFQVQRA